MTYEEQKKALLARINELNVEIAASDPESHTESLKAAMKAAAASGATDEELAEHAQAVRLAALGADDTGTKHSIAQTRKEAAEKQLAELEQGEAARIKAKREQQIKEINCDLIPKAKAEYGKVFQKVIAAHCKLAALVDNQLRIIHALRNNPNIPLNGASPVDFISLPIPFGADGIVDPAQFQSYRSEQFFQQAFASAQASVIAEIESIGQ